MKEQVIRSVGMAVDSLTPAKMKVIQSNGDTTDVVNDTRPPRVFDPGIRILYFEDLVGNVLGTLTSWANHVETIWSKNIEITSDFPHYIREGMKNGLWYGDTKYKDGIGGTHVYVNGAIGGLLTTNKSMTVVDRYNGESYRTPNWGKVRAVGYAIAGQALDAIESDTNDFEMNPTIDLGIKTFNVPVQNFLFIVARILGVIDRSFFLTWTGFAVKAEIDLLKVGNASLLTIPGEIYPEIVEGGIEAPEGRDFEIDPVEVPSMRELMGDGVNFVLGLANDELGYIIPKSEWDEKEPWLYHTERDHYGEENSVGYKASPIIYENARELIEEMR